MQESGSRSESPHPAACPRRTFPHSRETQRQSSRCGGCLRQRILPTVARRLNPSTPSPLKIEDCLKVRHSNPNHNPNAEFRLRSAPRTSYLGHQAPDRPQVRPHPRRLTRFNQTSFFLLSLSRSSTYGYGKHLTVYQEQGNFNSAFNYTSPITELMGWRARLQLLALLWVILLCHLSLLAKAQDAQATSSLMELVKFLLIRVFRSLCFL
jgi:hypothetical protein